jgi:hypothetical protein
LAGFDQVPRFQVREQRNKWIRERLVYLALWSLPNRIREADK